VFTNDEKDDVTLELKNDFTYNGFTTLGKCPLGAHIRKVHIRDNKIDPTGSTRIMRRGIPYGSDFVDGEPDTGRGLLFAAYQSTIEDGYRFLQRNWANDPTFPKPGTGFDVTIGQGGEKDSPEFGIDSKNSVTINPVNAFVTPIGGEYFFVPSIKVLRAGFDVKNLDKLKL
jgi:Dyp-type peroxidase family